MTQRNDLKIEALEKKLNYSFKNKELLYEALSHPSIKKISKNKKDYQRLEFLGNGILGAVMAKMLYDNFPKADEGKLSIIHSKMSSTDGIVNATKELEINKFMIVDIGEEKNNGRNNPRNIENCVEAIIGAVFVDGGYSEAEKMIIKLWHSNIRKKNLHIRDPKSRLQELCQKNSSHLPEYLVVGVDGPVHAPVFTVKCVAKVGINEFHCEMQGKNKKEAEQFAAQYLLDIISQSNL
jgi:ribonuclease-3